MDVDGDCEAMFVRASTNQSVYSVCKASLHGANFSHWIHFTATPCAQPPNMNARPVGHSGTT